MVEPVHTAEIRDSAFSGDARAAKKNDIPAMLNQIFQLRMYGSPPSPNFTKFSIAHPIQNKKGPDAEKLPGVSTAGDLLPIHF